MFRFGLIDSLLSDWRGTLLMLLLALPGRLLAISAHEAAHGWVADRCGDSTARMLGRVTLNPAKHLDPLGVLCMVFIGIGWAKPVPVNPRNFRNYRRDDLLVSIAGITMNLILFLLGSVVFYTVLGFAFRSRTLYRALVYQQDSVPYYLFEMLQYFIATNLSLAIFNLIPLPPLDGYHVLNDLLLKRPLFATPQAVRIGQTILLVAMFSGALSSVITWAYGGVTTLVQNAAIAVYQWIGLMG